MSNKKTYKSDDIEQLLLQKSYDELSDSEKKFADTQIDSSAEYNEMRATLLSIKRIAQEESLVEVSPKIKANLMEQMERKASRVPWYTLNGIAAFLFPTDTPLFKKPGLQFAVMGLLLLLVLNIGLKEFNTNKGQLAINTQRIELPIDRVSDNEISETTAIEEPNQENKNEVANKVEINETSERDEATKELIPQPMTPAIKEFEKTDDVIAEEEEDIVIQSEKVQAKKIEKVEFNYNKDYPGHPTTTRANSTISLSEVSVPNADYETVKLKTVTSNSQSLNEQEAVIDLLFVAL